MEKDDNDDAERHGTHPHAYKQLLVGWIVGAMDDERETMGKWAISKFFVFCFLLFGTTNNINRPCTKWRTTHPQPH